MPLFLDRRHVNKVGIPLPWIQLLAFSTDRRGHHHLHHLRVVHDGLRAELLGRDHLGHKVLHGQVVDRFQGHVPNVRIDPLLQMALPILDRGRSQGLPLAVFDLIEPGHRLLLERNAVSGLLFVEMLHAIRSAGRDDLLRLALPFGCGQFAWAGEGTDFFAHSLSLLSAPNDVPIAVFLNTTSLTLTRSSRH